MKRILLVLLVSVVIALNLNAAISVQKVWDPQSLSVSPGEEVACVQYRVTTDTAVNIEGVEIKSSGPVRSVFQKIAVRNGFGRVIGERQPDGNSDNTVVSFENTVVLPGMDFFITVQGQTAPVFTAEVIGQSTRLVPMWLRTSEGFFPLEDSGAAFIPSGKPSLGSVVTSKIGVNSNVYPGQKRFLGGFAVNAINGEFGGQMEIKLHILGGLKDDVQNITAVILYANGTWQFTQVWKSQEYADTKDFYTIGENLEISSSSVSLVGIFADIGQSFSNGGAVAVSTTLSHWNVWSSITGRRPVLPDRTVVGPTIKVMPQTISGGKG